MLDRLRDLLLENKSELSAPITVADNASWTFYTRPQYATSGWDGAAGTDFGFRPS